MDTEQMIEAVRDFLDNDDWHYEFNAERQYIHMGVNLKCKLKKVRVFVDFKRHGYVVRCVPPLNADKENLAEIYKYTSMANFALINGCFEIDSSDGEIAYRTFVPCENLPQLSKEVIEDSICVGCAMFDRYGDGFAALAMGFSDAETEIKKAEPDEE